VQSREEVGRDEKWGTDFRSPMDFGSRPALAAPAPDDQVAVLGCLVCEAMLPQESFGQGEDLTAQDDRGQDLGAGDDAFEFSLILCAATGELRGLDSPVGLPWA